MKRRSFFQLGLKKATQTVLNYTESQLEKQASRWLRPPFARSEIDFLVACSRCDHCVDRCPAKILFKLPLSAGVQVVGTPAMDLNQKGCLMCEGWPCVAVCEPNALSLPKSEENSTQPPLPKLSVVQIDMSTCLPYLGPECGACRTACPVPGALLWRENKMPMIDPKICTGCALCRQACILESKAISFHPLKPKKT